MEKDNKNLLTNFIFLKVIAIYKILLAQQQSTIKIRKCHVLIEFKLLKINLYDTISPSLSYIAYFGSS